MNWSVKYIGLSGADCHCWELVRRVYQAELKIDLPSYQGAVLSRAEREEVARLVSGEEQRGNWVRVTPHQILPFDVLVFRRGGLETHVAVAVDGALMLHMQDQARLDRFGTGLWSPRLRGVYRQLNCALEGGK